MTPERTFYYSHNNGNYSPDYAAQVTVVDANSPSVQLLTAQISQIYDQAGYSMFSQTFTAVSDSSTLSFVDTRGAYNAGIYLDDVSVQPVAAVAVPGPIAGAGIVPLIGLAGACVARRRTRLSV